MNIEDDHIWTVIKNLADERNRDLNDIDDEYKQQLIKGYKICKGKTYNFTPFYISNADFRIIL
jgi:hypothetical protein